MASIPHVLPSADARRTLISRSGQTAWRCYQCATCSSVCELAPIEAPFPRRQMLWAQWGLTDNLISDPGIWLCHQCNDCNVRCPRDAQPGDVLQSLRSLVVEKLAFPGFLGTLVGNVKKTWPLLVFGPLLFWLILLGVTTGLGLPHVENLPALEGRFHYETFVPHPHIYVVYSLTALWVAFAAFTGGKKLWNALGQGRTRNGSFIALLGPAMVEIATHKRFGKCGEDGSQRRWGHFFVLWGFVGAAVTSGLLILYLYKDTLFSWMPLLMPHTYPLPLHHPVKWLGNISAVALVIGGFMLFQNRRKTGRKVGVTTAFDRFFLWTVLGVIASGVLTETFRFIPVPPALACIFYLMHLSIVLTLFLTFPYSKFAHLVYRTVAMVHQLAVEKKA
jgi:quinone-modifying oxidoreductase subunit QmoC